MSDMKAVIVYVTNHRSMWINKTCQTVVGNAMFLLSS